MNSTKEDGGTVIKSRIGAKMAVVKLDSLTMELECAERFLVAAANIAATLRPGMANAITKAALTVRKWIAANKETKRLILERVGQAPKEEQK